MTFKANLDWSQAALNPFGVPDICLKRWDDDVSTRSTKVNFSYEGIHKSENTPKFGVGSI